MKLLIFSIFLNVYSADEGCSVVDECVVHIAQRLTALETKNNDLTGKVENLQVENDELKNQLEDVKIENRKLKNDVRELEAGGLKII